MARFLNEYKEIDTSPFYQKLIVGVTWVAFFLLIPGTVLGYFAEKSLPGQTLYSLKRGIEGVVLAVESVTPYSKSSYLQTLASTRIQETSDLVASAYSTSSSQAFSIPDNNPLDGVVFTVKEAQIAIEQIKDPVAKQQAAVQLATSVRNYQTQLSHIEYIIQVGNQNQAAPTPSPISPTTPSTVQTTNQPTVTPLPVSSASSTLSSQIQTVQQQLQDISSVLPPVSPTPAASPTLTSTPTPTLTPTPTNTPTPKPIPTFTPSPTPHRHGDSNGND